MRGVDIVRVARSHATAAVASASLRAICAARESRASRPSTTTPGSLSTAGLAQCFEQELISSQHA